MNHIWSIWHFRNLKCTKLIILIGSEQYWIPFDGVLSARKKPNPVPGFGAATVDQFLGLNGFTQCGSYPGCVPSGDAYFCANFREQENISSPSSQLLSTHELA